MRFQHGDPLIQWRSIILSISYCHQWRKCCDLWMKAISQRMRVLKELQISFPLEHSHSLKILIQLDELNKIKFTKKLTDLAKDWTQVTCLAISHSNHYTRLFSMVEGGCKWILIHACVILSISSYSFSKMEKTWLLIHVEQSDFIFSSFPAKIYDISSTLSWWTDFGVSLSFIGCEEWYESSLLIMEFLT